MIRNKADVVTGLQAARKIPSLSSDRLTSQQSWQYFRVCSMQDRRNTRILQCLASSFAKAATAFRIFLFRHGAEFSSATATCRSGHRNAWQLRLQILIYASPTYATPTSCLRMSFGGLPLRVYLPRGPM